MKWNDYCVRFSGPCTVGLEVPAFHQDIATEMIPPDSHLFLLPGYCGGARVWITAVSPQVLVGDGRNWTVGSLCVTCKYSPGPRESAGSEVWLGLTFPHRVLREELRAAVISNPGSFWFFSFLFFLPSVPGDFLLSPNSLFIPGLCLLFAPRGCAPWTVSGPMPSAHLSSCFQLGLATAGPLLLSSWQG